MYQPARACASEFVPIRNLRYHVRLWGDASADTTPLVMVHGWMDVAASWQFVIDAFAHDHYVIAPDWRGYGLTESSPGTDNYWFPDYLADLDFLLDHYAPHQPVHLVGHSMGGNVAMLYAGSRPGRVRKLANLEGFGMPSTRPSQAPGRYARWMDELKAFHRGDMALKTYDSLEGVAQRLMKTNPRLDLHKAQWLAGHWARCDEQGRWHILGDAAHKITNAQLFRVDEALELYKAITAPTLWVQAAGDSLSQWWDGRFTLSEFHERLKAVPRLQKAQIEDAGHMLHHDQPARLAHLLETFFADLP